eukprot:gene19323-25974_t
MVPRRGSISSQNRVPFEILDPSSAEFNGPGDSQLNLLLTPEDMVLSAKSGSQKGSALLATQEIPEPIFTPFIPQREHRPVPDAVASRVPE